ncbi:MAG: DUF229 domain-containing protein [Deltaproteobacteria bacterium]|nr:MAG: DUF229 domain-containing protein [Deltaproteobacteria bacterium]
MGTFRLVRDGGQGLVAAAAVALGAGLVVGLGVGHGVRWLLAGRSRVLEASLAGLLLAALGGAQLTGGQVAWPADAAGSATAARPNVILVIADTLRADFLRHDVKAASSLTPHLDAFAREAIRFERMYANSSWTRPAVASIHTGRLPDGHGVVSKVSPLPPDLPTLATELRKAGYATAASVTNVNLAEDFGFGRGFDAYHYHPPVRPLGARGPAVRLSLINGVRLVEERLTRALRPERFYAPASAINRTASELLDHLGDGPFFLWVHYMDAHDPYFHWPLDGRGIARVQDPHPPPEQAATMRALYEGEIRHWDAAFGSFLEELRRRGLLDRSIVVVTADHGEEFQDHGGYWHGQTLFDELTRVPLLIRLPGGAGGGQVDRHLASQVDILPTVLARLGLGVPPGVDGTDLLAEESGGETERAVIMEVDHDGMVLSGVVWDRYKYVRANPGNWRGLPEQALYDLEADPGEHRNLAPERPEEVEEVAALLDGHRRRGDASDGASQGTAPVELDTSLQEDLKALGYIQ